MTGSEFADAAVIGAGLAAAVLGYVIESRRDQLRERVAVLETRCEYLRERVDTLTARFLDAKHGDSNHDT